MAESVSSSQSSERQDALGQLSQSLQSKLEVKDRKWRAKTYRQCFLHSEAIELVMKSKNLKEENAVALLNELRLAGYLQHVVDAEKPFKAGLFQKKLYFCFSSDRNSHVRVLEEAKSIKESKKNKTVVKWETSEEFRAMQTKIARMESMLSSLNESQLSTTTVLEIVHQATISLIQTLVATAGILLLVLMYILGVIVPSLHQTQSIAFETTFLVGIVIIFAFVYQGMNLFSVWLALDSSVVQAAEGNEDEEEEDETVDRERKGGAMRPRPSRGLSRSASVFFKEPIMKATSSKATGSFATVQRKAYDLPHASEWPQRPVLLCLNTPVSRSLRVPNYGTGPCPIGVPFRFSSDLFEGQCLVRLQNISNSDNPKGDERYFSGRRRLFQCIVQGRFRESLPVSEVLTGHEFCEPLQNLPHPWILKASTNLIGKLAPGAEIQVLGKHPTMLAPLAATSQIVRGDAPGNEPDIATTDDLVEDCSLLGGKFASRTMSPAGRKLHLASPRRASHYTFDTETIYTFDFYQALLNVSTYSLDLGIATISMAPILNGQPIQCLCKTADGRYLWSFQVWHENLLPDELEKEKTN